MAEVEFGDSELFQLLDDDSAPLVPTHLRFTDEDEGSEETRILQSRLEESDAYIQKLLEENILVSVSFSVLVLTLANYRSVRTKSHAHKA